MNTWEPKLMTMGATEHAEDTWSAGDGRESVDESVIW